MEPTRSKTSSKIIFGTSFFRFNVEFRDIGEDLGSVEPRAAGIESNKRGSKHKRNTGLEAMGYHD